MAVGFGAVVRRILKRKDGRGAGGEPNTMEGERMKAGWLGGIEVVPVNCRALNRLQVILGHERSGTAYIH